MDLGLLDNSGLFHLKIINLIIPQRSFSQTWLHLQVLDMDISFLGPPLNPLLSLKRVMSVHLFPSSLHHPGPSLLGLLPQILSNWPLWLPFLHPNNPFFSQPEHHVTIYLKSCAPCPGPQGLLLACSHSCTAGSYGQLTSQHERCHLRGLRRGSCTDVLPQPHCAPVGRQVSLYSQHIPQLARILSLYLPTHSPNPSSTHV